MTALTTAEVTAKVGLSRCSLWRMVRAGTFPAARLLSPGRKAWLSDDIDEWLASRPEASSAEPAQLKRARIAR